MQKPPFPYSYSAKIAGVVIIILSIISFFFRYYEDGTFELNQLATGSSWGFLFIFFSKEKTDDEMIQSLKFKALTWSIIITFSLTCVYNYLFLYWWSKREHNISLSVSAFQFFALMLIIATARFYYLKSQVILNEEK